MPCGAAHARTPAALRLSRPRRALRSLMPAFTAIAATEGQSWRVVVEEIEYQGSKHLEAVAQSVARSARLALEVAGLVIKTARRVLFGRGAN